MQSYSYNACMYIKCLMAGDDSKKLVKFYSHAIKKEDLRPGDQSMLIESLYFISIMEYTKEIKVNMR